MTPRRVAACLAACLALGTRPAPAAPRAAAVVVDDFENVEGWSAHPADGVALSLRGDAGLEGRALRLDFRFEGGAGYAVARKAVTLALPDNYEFRFAIRGDCPPNNLEFKLIDSTGANVWWSNQRNVVFPERWDTVALRKRHIAFAWGPAGGGEIRRVAAIEIAITAGSGGEGTVWIDELSLRALPPAGAVPRQPVFHASSGITTRGSPFVFAGRDGPAAEWASGPGDRRPWLALDGGSEWEFGGVVIDWVEGRALSDYAIETSDDGTTWRTRREVRGGNGRRDPLYLPDSETRWLRVRALADAPRGCAVRGVRIERPEWASSLEAFFEAIAREAPRGSFPRAFSREQSYWAVVGTDGGKEECLLNEDGMLETGKASFSIEPFLFAGGRLITWSDVTTGQRLEEGVLPIPTVRWTHGVIELEVTAFADGAREPSPVYARYRVTNHGLAPESVTLFLALRPFQVNPPAQFLNTPGGTAEIRSLAARRGLIRVNGGREVVCLTAPSQFGAATFDEGDVVEFLRGGRLPPHASVRDPFAHASGALAFRLDLAPGAMREVDLLIPPDVGAPRHGASDETGRRELETRLAACRREWETRRPRMTIAVPDSARAVIETLEAQLAWILVDRDGPALQPGSRSYERAWIRDGALMSSALLRLGRPEVAREFLEWFAGYQYPNGKVPCCVDARGADPVPEHDSSGELIYLVAEVYRYTGDRSLVERLWPRVAAAASYLDSLRQQRRTREYRARGREAFFGLLPPSISHEGYSAKPMHSYWDDFFALRGFKDAAMLAGVLRREDDRRRLVAIRDEFQRELARSIAAAMNRHRIGYVPGCADLGDFDPTSTAIALAPTEAANALPRAAVERTFEKYWTFFRARRDGRIAWRDFTPYETRLIGAFVRLGWRDRAYELLQFFMAYRRPPGWAQWAEVVRPDERTPGFIGDMPHGWVGAEFARSVLDLFAYEREADSALVVAAGVPREWAARGAGVSVSGLATPYGRLSYTLRAAGDTTEVRIASGPLVPRGGIVVSAPRARRARRATVNGAPARLSRSGDVVVRALPASVVLRP